MELFRPRWRLSAAFLTATFCFCLSGAFSGGAFAQSAASVASSGTAALASDDEDIVILDTFEVSSRAEVGYYSGNSTSATRLDTPINETPQSIYVINKALIDDVAAASLGDLLGYTPEMSVGETSDDRLGPSMRGNTVGDPLINGVALQNRGTVFSMANIERAEIVAGPTSIFLANESGIGGGINLSTKKPNFKKAGGSTEVQMKSGDTLRLVCDYGQPVAYRSNWAWRVVVEGIKARQEDGFVEDFASMERVGFMPSLGWRPSKDTVFYLSGEFFIQNTNRPRGADLIRADQIIQVPVDANVNSGFDKMERTQGSLSLLFMHALSRNWALRGIAMGTYNDNLKDTMMLNGGDSYPNLAQGLIAWARTGIEQYHEIRTNYALQVDLAGSFRTGPLMHQLVVGCDFKYNSSKQDYNRALFPNDEQLFDVYHPDYDITPGAPFPHRRVNSRGTRTNFYVSENIKMLRDRIILNLGVRASDFSQSADRHWYFPKPDAPHVDYPSEWTFKPRAGIVVKIIEPISLYYGYTETYIPRTDVTNPDNSFIAPETGVQHEVGVKALLFKQRVIINSSVYDLDRKNVTEQDSALTQYYGGIPYYTAERSVRIRGWNLKLTLNPLPGLQLNGSYSALDPEITNSLNNPAQIGLVPKYTAKDRYNWNVRYEVRKGSLRGVTFGVFAKHVGYRLASFPNDSTTGKAFVIPAYDRYDAFIRYARKKWSIQLNVNNIFDKRCYTYADYSQGGGTIRREPPREFAVTFRTDF